MAIILGVFPNSHKIQKELGCHDKIKGLKNKRETLREKVKYMCKPKLWEWNQNFYVYVLKRTQYVAAKLCV